MANVGKQSKRIHGTKLWHELLPTLGFIFQTETDAEFNFVKQRMITNGVPFIWTSGRKCNFDGCQNRPGKCLLYTLNKWKENGKPSHFVASVAGIQVCSDPFIEKQRSWVSWSWLVFFTIFSGWGSIVFNQLVTGLITCPRWVVPVG